MDCKKAPVPRTGWTAAVQWAEFAAFTMQAHLPNLADPFAQEFDVSTDKLAPFQFPAEAHDDALLPRLCANDACLTSSGGDFGFVDRENPAGLFA